MLSGRAKPIKIGFVVSEILDMLPTILLDCYVDRGRGIFDLDQIHASLLNFLRLQFKFS